LLPIFIVGTANAQTVSASASRSSGVAPLYVSFTAGYSASSGSQGEFHSNEYLWDFGDSSAGTWGTSGVSKNKDKGPVAAHVYETAGSYAATLKVRNASGTVSSQAFHINVSDPDSVYSGLNTVCIASLSQNDFAGCPAGARHVATDDISEISNHVGVSKRVLLHRGSAWNSTGENIPNGSGPTTLGAYGACSDPDELGICSNAPLIALSGTPIVDTFLSLSRKQDWRIMDIHFSGTSAYQGAIGGAINIQRILMLRLKAEGFNTPLGNSHWKGSPSDLIDQVALVSSDVSGGITNCVYIGAERLAILGNRIYDASQSHVLRVWQLYLGVIRHNLISGANVDVARGRHALKLHGPAEDIINPSGIEGVLNHRTHFAVVSDNVFGASGPWPVSVGPQDALHDERVSDILFERNKLITQFGTQSPDPVQVSLHIWGSYISVRNNVIDGTGSSNGFTGIRVTQRGAHPNPVHNTIYNNTIYRRDSGPNEHRGIDIDSAAGGTIVRNNLVSFPAVSNPVAVRDQSADLIQSNNLHSTNAGFVDPDNTNPLNRDFAIQATSPARNQGVTVPLLDDVSGASRVEPYDLGAYEYHSNARPAAPTDLRMR
jgi:PKD repeat protein